MKRNVYCIPCALEGRAVLASTVVDGDPACAPCALAAAKALAEPCSGAAAVREIKAAADDPFPVFHVREKRCFCRWSDDDFGCQLFCYEDREGGYATHLAGNRAVGAVPRVTAELMDDPNAFAAQMRAQIQFMLTAEWEPVRLPLAGESFHDATLAGLRTRLLELRAVGYRFPASVLEQVDAELAEGKVA